MATFPTLNPSTRTFTPGEYPHRSFLALSGKQNRVRNSNVMLGSQLRLSFLAITESQMLSILSHYQGQRGSFQSFALPSLVWNGTSNVSDYQLQGYGWIYKEPPTVADAMCADAYDVDLTLETVPPEGTAILGLEQLVRISLAPGVAFAVNSVTLTVAWTLSPGSAGYPGLNETVTASLAAGTATAGVTAAGLDFAIIAVLSKGPDALGLASTVTASLSPGIATAGDPYASSVSMLLHFDGSNNSTTFTDSTSTPLTPLVFGASKISTTQSKFGGASAYFDGNADYLRYTFNSDFDLLGGDFTVECWVYPEQFKDGMRIAAAGGGSAFFNSTNGVHWRMTFTTAGALRLEVRNSSGNGTITSTATATANTWTHVAVCVSGSTGYVGVGGTVLSGSLGTIQRPSTDPVLTIATVNDGGGGSSTTAFQGFIDEFRITKTVARYIANYTVPTEAFPNP